MASFKLKAELINADRALGGLDAMIIRADNMSRPLGRLLIHLQRKTQRVLRSGEKGIQARNASSGLLGSITYAFKGPNEGFLGSNKKYAAAQQFGPRNGYFESSRPNGYLAIPIGDNLGARNNAKYQSPRDVPGGFFLRNGNTLLFVSVLREGSASRLSDRKLGRQTAKGNFTKTVKPKMFVWFKLAKRVTGKAHGYVYFDENDLKQWDIYAADWIIRGR